MAPALHATLGASSAHRWMTCPGSIRMGRDMPNEGSVFAREGSAAHAIGERALVSGKEAIDYFGVTVEDYPEVEVDEAMCAAVQEYLDAVRGEIARYEAAGFTDAELMVEVRFDLSHIYPDMFGTCDAVVYLPEWKQLKVFDYKHGWVSVPVERNPQTLYYALGAISGKHNRAVTEIELIIVQPRSGRHTIVKRWACDVIDLLDFMSDLIAAAKQTEDPAAALKPGEWCKFCPAAPVCRALTTKVEEIIMAEYDPITGIKLPEPDKIPFERLREVWENASMIEGWIKNVKAYAHAQAIAGNPLPRTKLVEGRAYRKWIDEAAAEKTLGDMAMIGHIPGEIFVKKLKSPSQIEDMLPKKEQKMIKDLWKKGQGALTLVPDTDERPSAKVDAASEFS